MGTSISALLIISVLLTAVVVMFKANQIGAELLAVANKNAAETIADKVSTKIEITSTQDFKASYEDVTKHNVNDVEGCIRIYPGIARTGTLTVTNEIDCYWKSPIVAMWPNIKRLRRWFLEVRTFWFSAFSSDFLFQGSQLTGLFSCCFK